ncbi:MULTISPECIES: hypothetical protein [unclassified Sphingomonas]|uniref:hypothetical protein n=1 Tax=unclassified Sphingomonas TaxID=196159 RepID=UPI00215123A2|nr:MULTISPECIES: hypothetical protein [unclassified Sphingomonas]MCR5870802.1 hypothetical protein [Sphingomonas sp. J344]UUY00866.1 hypothetical protein LRS08_07320 [Sphingomonas sp. J315]
MRHKTLFSLIALGGSTAAIAAIGTPQAEPPLQNELTNEAVPDDTTAPETLSNRTDVEPSADPTHHGTETVPEPNSTFY